MAGEGDSFFSSSSVCCCASGETCELDVVVDDVVVVVVDDDDLGGEEKGDGERGEVERGKVERGLAASVLLGLFLFGGGLRELSLFESLASALWLEEMWIFVLLRLLLEKERGFVVLGFSFLGACKLTGFSGNPL